MKVPRAVLRCLGGKKGEVEAYRLQWAPAEGLDVLPRNASPH